MRKLSDFFMLLFVFCVVGCVDVELCEEEHPHSTLLSFDYKWDKLSENMYHPDSMFIVANKIINSTVTTIGYSIKTQSGTYLSNKPENLKNKYNHDLPEFTMRTGDYKFITMNHNSRSFNSSQLYDYVMQNSTKALGDLWISYYTYERTSWLLDKPVEEWRDYNEYFHDDGTKALYIQPSEEPLIVDTSDVETLVLHEPKKIVFTPNQLSHNIDVYFDLKKRTDEIDFEIDSVYCIISGIPERVNISTGAIDISRTNKMMYKAMLTSTSKIPDKNAAPMEDTRSNKAVRCYQNVDVLGIIEKKGATDDDFSGPGVLQLIIYCKVYDDHNDSEAFRCKRVYGVLNIHNALITAALQTYDEKQTLYKKSRDHTDLYIKLDVSLGAVELQRDDDGGIDHWREEELDGYGFFDIY